jgi:uncharacterized protein
VRGKQVSQVDEEAPEPVVVPHAELDAETLQAVVESFVLREGTEYGERDFTLAEKVAHVIGQLERGEAQIVFEAQSQSVDIVPVAKANRRAR